MKKGKILRNPYIRISIVAITLAVIVSAIVFFVILAQRTLFKENPHFVLQHVVVQSSGYWNNRSGEISKILDLRKGIDNLFELNIASLKKELIRRREYSIENVEIYKMIPDTLTFRITERIPRALLYNKKSELLVDGNAVIINKAFCVDIDSELPIITGFKIRGINASQSLGKEKIPYGRVLYQIKPALSFISLVNTNYPEFNIKLINLYNDNELDIFMPGPLNKKIIRVKLPFNYSKNVPLTRGEYQKGTTLLKDKLVDLQKLYRYLRIRKKSCKEINLLFKGQAVVE
jgi:hypothetical protein